MKTFNEITNGSDEWKKSDVESGDQTDTNENVTPDDVILENDVSNAEKDDTKKFIAKKNGIQVLTGKPKILTYPEGTPEKRGRQHVIKMFESHAKSKDNWDYRDALEKFKEMYPRAATGDPRDPWRKKNVNPCSNRKCDI